MEGDIITMYVFKLDSINLTCYNSAEPPANMSWTFEGVAFTNPIENYMVRIL